MNTKHPIKSCELVCASETDEEFYYKDSNLAVQGGDPIGVDIEIGKEVHLILLDGVYWGEKSEEAEEDSKVI